MEHESEKTIFERFTIYMEQDTRGVELVTYGIASIGLLAALYRIRPFTKFTKPSDVPAHFLKSRVPLQGTAVRIEPNNGPLIMVDHESLIPLPRLRRRQLPVKIAGVDVTSNGISWLQSVVIGNKIVFVPLNKEKGYLECTVTMPRKDEESLQIGLEIVKLGFGTIKQLQPTLLQNKKVLTYQKSLIAAQKWAEHERNGYWHFTLRPTLLWKIRNAISKKSRSLLPEFMTRQLNI